METLLLTGILSQYIIPLVGIVITCLVGWGVRTLKARTQSQLAKNALDQIDQIVATVVGQVAQTTAKQMRKVAKDGHLSREDRNSLKLEAINQAQGLMSQEVFKAAECSVTNVTRYIQHKIEEQVLIGKGKGHG